VLRRALLFGAKALSAHATRERRRARAILAGENSSKEAEHREGGEKLERLRSLIDAAKQQNLDQRTNRREMIARAGPPARRPPRTLTRRLTPLA